MRAPINSENVSTTSSRKLKSYQVHFSSEMELKYKSTPEIKILTCYFQGFLIACIFFFFENQGDCPPADLLTPQICTIAGVRPGKIWEQGTQRERLRDSSHHAH